MNQKIQGEKLRRLKKFIEDRIESVGWQRIKSAYESGRFPRSEKVRDLNVRLRWDLLWSANNNGARELIAQFYRDGLNDSHIDTALRQIVPTIQRKY